MTNQTASVWQMVKRSRYQQPEGNKVAAINPVWVVSHCESNYAKATYGGRTALVDKYHRCRGVFGD